MSKGEKTDCMDSLWSLNGVILLRVSWMGLVMPLVYSRAIKQVFILLAKLNKDRVQSLIYPVRGMTRKTRPGAEAGQDMLRLTWLPCLNNDIQNKV